MVNKLFLVLALLLTTVAHSGDITWNGRYRWEALSLNSPLLEDNKQEKSYMLHHLILQPKIVAADGLNIFGRFDILNNSSYGNSQVGQMMGNGPRTTTSSTTSDSSTLSQTQQSEDIKVTHLYLSWLQDSSMFLVGRMPVHFGLGITHNDGSGEFDHWLDTRDMVSYKFIFGNMLVHPMYGKVYEGGRKSEDDINDYMVHVQYDNDETKTKFGVFYEWRKASKSGNDAPVSRGTGTSSTDVKALGPVTNTNTRTERWDGKMFNVFIERGFEELSIGLESSFHNALTGVMLSDGREVSVDAYAVASELKWTPNNSNWALNFKLGIISGDDPGSSDKYEGYLIDKNYDVAMLLFNHPLGRTDTLKTSMADRGDETGVDQETLSNAFYLAPTFHHKLSDKWNALYRFVYATLQTTDPGVSRALGYEFDFGLAYKPHSKLTWLTEVGWLFPGDAWMNGSSGYAKHPAFAIGTKAAISF